MILPEILRTAVASGYSTKAATSWCQLVIEERDWEPAVLKAIENNLGPMLFNAFRRQPEFSLPPVLLDELHNSFFDSATHHLLISHKLEEIVTALISHGVPVILLKGAVLSKTIYPDPALRPMVDIDLLIPFIHFDQSCRTLELLGYERNGLWPMDNEAGLFFNELDFTSMDASKCNLELHWNLIDVPYFSARLTTGDLFMRAVPAPISPAGGLMLSVEDQLLHLAVHNTYHHMGSMPVAFADTGYFLSKYESIIDWQLLIQRAIEKELSSPLQSTLLESYRRWYGSVPETILPWLYEIQPTMKERILVKSQKRKISRVFRNFLTLPGISHKISYLRGHIFPNRKYLVWRYRLKPDSPLFLAHIFRLAAGLRRIFSESRKLLFGLSLGKQNDRSHR